MSAARTASSLMPMHDAALEAALPAVAKWPGGGDARTVLLRNSGARPLRVRGELLAEGSSMVAGLPCWHEISLYQCDDGQVAIAQRTRQSHAPEGGTYRAVLRADMDAACAWLEGFDATADLDAGFDVADMSVSTTAIAVKAAALRDRVERVTREYRCLIGEVLYRLAAEG